MHEGGFNELKFQPDEPGLIRVELPRGCFLLLTKQEFERGILRGKAARRREQHEGRRQSEGSLVEALAKEKR